MLMLRNNYHRRGAGPRNPRNPMTRPRLDSELRRSRTIGVRVTAAEAAEIAERAASARLTAAAYMRRRTLGRPVRVTAVHRLAAAERVELQRIGANLNQVARALHSGAVQVPAGTLEAVERVADLVADLLTGEGLG